MTNRTFFDDNRVTPKAVNGDKSRVQSKAVERISIRFSEQTNEDVPAPTKKQAEIVKLIYKKSTCSDHRNNASIETLNKYRSGSSKRCMKKATKKMLLCVRFIGFFQSSPLPIMSTHCDTSLGWLQRSTTMVLSVLEW